MDARSDDSEAGDPPLDSEEGFGETLILGPEIERRMAEARKALQAHDYFGCVRALSKIPERMRTPEVRKLRERAAMAAEELNRVQSEVKQALRARAYDGLIPKIERFRKLRPGDARYDNVLAQLREREASRAGSSKGPHASKGQPRKGFKPKVAFQTHLNELLRYLQVGAFAGGVLGALLGGFWKPEGFLIGGVLGGALASVNEWKRKR